MQSASEEVSIDPFLAFPCSFRKDRPCAACSAAFVKPEQPLRGQGPIEP